ncbi:hypothetical protein [Burkholderia cepacia]|uniref:hypothetical protein n=1 Tax=Burkholderia cepacia TaxID=292 RepID=UPI000A73589D|nr:hypothetical protein [Burkholderia cepacia]
MPIGRVSRVTAATGLSTLAALVDATSAPFAQAVLDPALELLVSGRAVLLGNAACPVRPHTAAGENPVKSPRLIDAPHQKSSRSGRLFGRYRSVGQHSPCRPNGEPYHHHSPIAMHVPI